MNDAAAQQDDLVKSFADPRAQQFRLEVRAWAAEVLTPELKSVAEMTEDEGVELRRVWDRMLHQRGYAGLSWPAAHGGGGAGAILETILHEELAAAHAPEGLSRIGRVVAGPLIIAEGNEDQKSRFLPKILDGGEIWCLGFSEPQAGSDLPSITTRARRVEGGYRVTGRKIWTSHAHRADRSVMLVKTASDRPKTSSITVLLLDMRQPGVIVSPVITSAGDHHFNEVLLEDAFVAEADRLGEENEGWRVFRASLAMERGGGVALNHYLEMRRQCDTLIACCAAAAPAPDARARAEALSCAVEIVRWHVMRGVEMEANGLSSKSALSVTKLYFSELWQELMHFALGCGCERHKQLWRYQYMRSRAATIYAGTSEIQRSMIARRLMSDVA